MEGKTTNCSSPWQKRIAFRGTLREWLSRKSDRSRDLAEYLCGIRRAWGMNCIHGDGSISGSRPSANLTRHRAADILSAVKASAGRLHRSFAQKARSG